MFSKKSIVIFVVCSIIIYILGLLIPKLVLDTQADLQYVLNFNTIFFVTVTSFIASASSFVGLKRVSLQASIGKAFLFMGISMAANGLGFATWFFIESVLLTDPYPSIADLFYLIFTVCLGVGVLYLIKIFILNISKTAVIQAIFLALIGAWLLITMAGLSFPTITDGITASDFFDIIYTISSMLFLGLILLIVRISGGRIFSGLMFVVLGILATLLGDILFAVRTTNETYFTGDISDLMYLISGFVFAAGLYITALNFAPKNVPAQ